MLKHTRVSGIADTNRMAAAFSRPGIDPRWWISYATVTAVGVDAEGVFVDVTTMPNLEELCARLGADYAGPSYGFHMPIGLDDEVLVGAPSGDPAHGVVVIRRFHSPSDPPPKQLLDNPDDVILVVRDGQSFRLCVSGAGKGYLGAADADQALLLGNAYRSAEDTLLSVLSTVSVGIDTFTKAFIAYTKAIQALADPPGNNTQVVNTAAGAFGTLGELLATAISSFKNAGSSYLSKVMVTK